VATAQWFNRTSSEDEPIDLFDLNQAVSEFASSYLVCVASRCCSFLDERYFWLGELLLIETWTMLDSDTEFD